MPFRSPATAPSSPCASASSRRKVQEVDEILGSKRRACSTEVCNKADSELHAPEIWIQLDRDSPGSHLVLLPKDMAHRAAIWPRFQVSHSLTQSMTVSRTPGKARGTGVQEGSKREAGAAKTLAWRLHTTSTPRTHLPWLGTTGPSASKCKAAGTGTLWKLTFHKSVFPAEKSFF